MIGSIHISADAIALIQKEADTANPSECCGLLIGSADEDVHVDQVVPAVNQASDPNRFLIDPQVQFDWMRKLRGSAQSIIGHYHSHPNGEPKPSVYDRQMAHEDGQVWLIVAVVEGIAGEVRGFVCQAESDFAEIPMRVQP